MRRYCAYNSLVAVAFLLFWAGLVVIEVRVALFWFLRLMYIASLLLVFVGFFAASRRALQGSSQHPVGFAVLSSVLISPVFIFLGGALVTSFKFMIGGRW
jgi:hypothetical protein